LDEKRSFNLKAETMEVVVLKEEEEELVES